MGLFEGYDFYFCLILSMVPAIALGLLGKSLRWYRAAATVFFIWMTYRDTPAQLSCLLAYAAGATYLVRIYLALRKRFGRNRYLYGHAVLLAVLPLAVYKIGGAFGKSALGFLGISYICFRVVQVIIEIYDGVITEIREGQFLMFLLFFPGLSSGPVDRSRRFAQDDDIVYSREEYAGLLGEGMFRLVLGAFYKTVCSAYLYRLLREVFEGRYGPQYLIGYAYVYGLYLFFDFAGYSSMAVGASYIFGIRMPGNFDRPFLSVDMKDFWNRWHITLSAWFRDFVFTRFMVDSARRKRFRSRLWGVCAGLVLNMGIMGIWHGIGAHYIAYGLYHGMILGATEVYQKKSAFHRKHRDRIWYRGCSWFLTLNMAMFGFLIFSGYLQQAVDALKNYL